MCVVRPKTARLLPVNSKTQKRQSSPVSSKTQSRNRYVSYLSPSIIISSSCMRVFVSFTRRTSSLILLHVHIYVDLSSSYMRMCVLHGVTLMHHNPAAHFTRACDTPVMSFCASCTSFACLWMHSIKEHPWTAGMYNGLRCTDVSIHLDGYASDFCMCLV